MTATKFYGKSCMLACQLGMVVMTIAAIYWACAPVFARVKVMIGALSIG